LDKNNTARKLRTTIKKILLLRFRRAAKRGTMACYFLLPPHVTDVCWRVADLVRKTVSKIKYMGKGEIRKENKCLSLSWLNDV
jgi:hypothetical protein